MASGLPNAESLRLSSNRSSRIVGRRSDPDRQRNVRLRHGKPPYNQGLTVRSGLGYASWPVSITRVGTLVVSNLEAEGGGQYGHACADLVRIAR